MSQTDGVENEIVQSGYIMLFQAPLAPGVKIPFIFPIDNVK